MIIGFTGTRSGMSLTQKDSVINILNSREWVAALHGDCVGADEEFHEMAVKAGIPVIIHPPVKDDLRAFCRGAFKIEKPEDYLVRNHHIVDSCDILIATPRSSYEFLRSGTWATIRYAKKVSKKMIVIDP